MAGTGISDQYSLKNLLCFISTVGYLAGATKRTAAQKIVCGSGANEQEIRSPPVTTLARAQRASSAVMHIRRSRDGPVLMVAEVVDLGA
jgi:predicted NAD/FAD-binding protein